LFAAALAASLAVVVGITIVISVMPGPSTLVAGVLIGLFLSAVLAAAALFADFQISAWQQRLVWDVDGFENCTSLSEGGLACSPGSATQQLYQPVFDVFAQIASAPQVGFVATSIDVAFAAIAAQLDATAVVGFALGVLGLAATWWVYEHPSDASDGLATSVVLDGASFLLDSVSIEQSRGASAQNPAKKAALLMDGVSYAMDGVSLTADALKWACGYNHC
jgi:hypothetical protein